MPETAPENNCKDLLIFVLHSLFPRGIFRAFGVCGYGEPSFRECPEYLECLKIEANSFSVSPSGLLRESLLPLFRIRLRVAD
jgi:hypothetical protein